MVFVKGQSGNPGGRVKREWTIRGLIEEAMEEQDETGVPYKKAIYKKLVRLAAKGDMQAAKELNNRLEGMAPQSLDLTTQGEKVNFNMDAVIGLSGTPAKTTTGDTDAS